MITIQTPRLSGTNTGSDIINTILFLVVAAGIIYGIFWSFDSQPDKSKK